jgi:cyanate lyase
VRIAAAPLGQHPLPSNLARVVGETLSLSVAMVAIQHAIPTRGAFDALSPIDPPINRLLEVLKVFGPALKALILEVFGRRDHAAIAGPRASGISAA